MADISEQTIAAAISQGTVTNVEPGATENLKNINTELSTTSQIFPGDLAAFAAKGFKSIVNLRLPTEKGFQDLQTEADKYGLRYFHAPLNDDALTTEMVDYALGVVDFAPKPAVVYCRTNRRAKAIGLTHNSLRQEVNQQQPLETVEPELDTACDRSPGMKAFMMKYVNSKITMATALPKPTKVSESLYVAGQVTEKQIEQLKEEGVKSVLNLRHSNEIGKLGLGVLAREQAIVEGLGLKYVNIPVSGAPTPEQVKEIADVLIGLEKPVLVHCLAGRRAEKVVTAIGNPYVATFFEKTTNTATYVVVDINTAECAIIDSVLGFDINTGKINTSHADTIIEFVKSHQLQVKYILETHVHADHLTAAQYLRKALGGHTGIGRHVVEVQQHFSKVFNLTDLVCDGSQFDVLFDDGQEWKLGSLTGSALHTPGHTPACMCYVLGNCVFVGDTIFMPDMGTARCDFPGGSATTLYNSVQKIYKLDDSYRVFVGHDYAPGGRALAWETTIKELKEHNKSLAATTPVQEFVSWREGRDRTLDPPKLLLPSLQVNLRNGVIPLESNGQAYIKIPVTMP